MTVYCIDLKRKNLAVQHANMKDLLLEADNVGTSLDAIKYDLKIFKNEQKADAWLELYNETAKKLKNLRCKTDCKAKILYKRRYLIQTLMHEKNQTYRDSARVNKMLEKIKPGETFTLYDQTHFLKVKLTKVTKMDGNNFRYDFKIA